MTIPFVEFFSGIGGFAAACNGRSVQVVAAYDQNEAARTAYAATFGAASPIDLCGLGPDDPQVRAGQGWWLSPPCQPYSTKGRQRDMDDPRARALTNLTALLSHYRPDYVMLENVPPFATSRSRAHLVAQLQALEMDFRESLICPTSFGIPNRRNRYYLIASREPIGPPPPRPHFGHGLSHYLDTDRPPKGIPESLLARLDWATNIVDAQGIPGVFGSSYGRAIHGAGDYYFDGHVVRRFTPQEILRLLHFPPEVRFPESLNTRSRYKLAGNSVNVAVVGYLLDWLIRR